MPSSARISPSAVRFGPARFIPSASSYLSPYASRSKLLGRPADGELVADGRRRLEPVQSLVARRVALVARRLVPAADVRETLGLGMRGHELRVQRAMTRGFGRTAAEQVALMQPSHLCRPR